MTAVKQNGEGSQRVQNQNQNYLKVIRKKKNHKNERKKIKTVPNQQSEKKLFPTKTVQIKNQKKEKKHKEKKHKEKKDKKHKKEKSLIEGSKEEISTIHSELQQALDSQSISICKDLLQKLGTYSVSMDILKETALGKTIKKLRK